MNYEDKFEQSARKICEAALEGSTGLTEALQKCEGLFPSIAVEYFSALDNAKTKVLIEQAYLEYQSRELAGRGDAQSFFLSTWYFSEECLADISRILFSDAGRYCLLGVQTLLPYLPKTEVHEPHILVDLQTPGSEKTHTLFLCKDINELNGTELKKACDGVVLDPPWYVENYYQWIDIGSSYVKERGALAFPLLGKMTRPSAELDREKIFAYCREKGLELEVHSNFILYEPPSFERSMLVRAGIPPVPWKRADLIVATLTGGGAKSKLKGGREPVQSFGQVRIANYLLDVVFDRYELGSEIVVDWPSGGYWMETPSRRVSDIANCNVFISNGTKFISSRPIDLYYSLKSIESQDIEVQISECEKLGFPRDVFS